MKASWSQWRIVEVNGDRLKPTKVLKTNLATNLENFKVVIQIRDRLNILEEFAHQRHFEMMKQDNGSLIQWTQAVNWTKSSLFLFNDSSWLTKRQLTQLEIVWQSAGHRKFWQSTWKRWVNPTQIPVGLSVTSWNFVRMSSIVQFIESVVWTTLDSRISLTFWNTIDFILNFVVQFLTDIFQFRPSSLDPLTIRFTQFQMVQIKDIASLFTYLTLLHSHFLRTSFLFFLPVFWSYFSPIFSSIFNLPWRQRTLFHQFVSTTVFSSSNAQINEKIFEQKKLGKNGAFSWVWFSVPSFHTPSVFHNGVSKESASYRSIGFVGKKLSLCGLALAFHNTLALGA